ncbi:MAG TPA: acetyltransferase, partial [Candidatus Pseudogracilibacillus intestinigallinarum]|nr:acetyltransferase [Candidatus Pseudogracilibacillus intestinigallinarum]
DEYRIGEVNIGSNVLIGANSTILPGVTIGDGAIVSAASLVHKDVPPGAFVGGNPMQLIYTKEEMEARNKNES